MEKVKVLQIGAGQFGQSWLPIIQHHPDAELTAVADVAQEHLAAVREQTGLAEERLFSDVALALRQSGADLVLIVTPPHTHKELSLQALKAGKHVMMEKPLTYTYEEAVELLKASRNYDKRVMVSQNYRWNRPIQTLKRVLQDGIIGKVGYVEYAFRKAHKFGGWRDQFPEILLEDMSIHHFDILRYLLGKEPIDLYAQSSRPEWSWFRGKPVANVVMRFDDDIHVSYFGSWVTRGRQTTWNGDIRIVGAKGAIDMTNDAVRVELGEGVEVEESIDVDLVELPYEDRGMSLDDMIQAIRQGREPQTSIEDNIRSFEIQCMAVASAQSGEKITVRQFSKIDRASGRLPG